MAHMFSPRARVKPWHRMITSPAAAAAASILNWGQYGTAVPRPSRKRQLTLPQQLARKRSRKTSQPMVNRRQWNSLKRYRRGKFRTARARYHKKRRSRKGREVRLRGGGRKIAFMTQIMPREVFVKLPFRKTVSMTKINGASMGNVWMMSLRNSLYWPFENSETGSNVRSQQMVRGTDFWAGGYRQYEIKGFKAHSFWEREADAFSNYRIYPMIHKGVENRVSRSGTAFVTNFYTQKNTRVLKPLYAAAAIQSEGGAKSNARNVTYLSVKSFARDAVNQGQFSALTGLPASAGANSTDPGFSCFINFGLGDHAHLETTDGDYGQISFNCTYYVRFFDRKYFQQDLDGDGDDGPATQQTAVPVVQPS